MTVVVNEAWESTLAYTNWADISSHLGDICDSSGFLSTSGQGLIVEISLGQTDNRREIAVKRREMIQEEMPLLW